DAALWLVLPQGAISGVQCSYLAHHHLWQCAALYTDYRATYRGPDRLSHDCRSLLCSAHCVAAQVSPSVVCAAHALAVRWPGIDHHLDTATASTAYTVATDTSAVASQR